MGELTEEQVTELREAFSAHDRDGDGRITLQELRQTLERLDEEPIDAELRGLIVKADADGNETIDFSEFLAFMSRRMRGTGAEDEIREAFDAFDRNRDGLVSIDELLQVMGMLREKMTREEAEASLQRGDSDGDGQLTYEEFVAFMMSPR
ncbi:EF-hand domain-containing protein [Hyalangium sp.]|uniref:EF-hand domain-containing protein n=1 Tax=Hyalangium sp. TaxID=2028555 RepID=UPI002D5DB972|nr:EF-hand domain-containing protein [Hyalangium sp.]HYI02095.1 EF-hand domain-containing protein [Hyalangium sp.]